LDSNLFALLERRCGSRDEASATLEALSLDLGLPGGPQTYSLAALALILRGEDSQKVASQLEWNEFEELCAKLLSAAGFQVTRNIVLTKPRKQIDLFARSSLMSLAIDCKHYARAIDPGALGRFAKDQVDRARLYKTKKDHFGPVLPMILTLVESTTVVVEGVPVVPILKLRDFLQTINPYESLAVV